MGVAKITVPKHYELDVLAHRAGADYDIIFNQMYYEDGQLFVPGVTQQDLDASLAAYDYEARMLDKYPPQPKTLEVQLAEAQATIVQLNQAAAQNAEDLQGLMEYLADKGVLD